MPTLRADENRYLVFAQNADEAGLLRGFPGGRFNPQQRCWVFPRQMGVVLALDRAFGREWAFSADVDEDVAEARVREMPPAEHTARVTLEGTQLAVECTVADKELVKLVPGYRWSPAQRRWHIAAQPMALDILRERFGAKLVVDATADRFVEERRREAAMRAPAARVPVREEAAPVAAAAGDIPGERAVPLEQTTLPDGTLRALVAVMERIEAKLDTLLAGRTGVIEVHPEQPGEEVAGREPAAHEPENEWERLFDLAASDPAAALDQANRLMQTSEGEERELRAVAGIAAQAAGDPEQAFRHLSRALEAGISLDPALQERAERAYELVALALVESDCRPGEPLADAGTFQAAIFRELVDDNGFEGAAIGSGDARGTLDLLVNDRALPRVSQELSDYCRIAQLLSMARGGTRLVAERVAAVLREGSLAPEAAALGMILFANTCMQASSAAEWLLGWPANEDEAPVNDGAWLVELALEVLPKAPPELAAHAVLAVLASIAPGPAEQASLGQRRELVALIPPGWPNRMHAEFLAVFRLAASGERIQMEKQFPGYLKRIGLSRLENSAAHLTEVYLAGSSVPGSAVKPIADGPYLDSLIRWGITEPQSQVLDLLDLLSEGSKPDNTLNALGELVEDGDFTGADRFSRQQRRVVYERALAASLQMGHDEDAREAFDRLVRALRDEGADEELRELCANRLHGLRKLRLPALVVLLGALLEAGQPVDDELRLAFDTGLAGAKADEDESVLDELLGLGEIYPALVSALRERAKAEKETVAESEPALDFGGRRVVVVGGHRWLRKVAEPALKAWNLRVEWFDPEQSKGDQVIEAAKGTSDLVVVNVRCIGHAGSGRVMEAARAAGVEVREQRSRGVGSMLTFVRRAMAEVTGEIPVQEVHKMTRADERRKLVR